MGPFTVTKRGKNTWDHGRAVSLSMDRDEMDKLVTEGIIKQSFDNKKAQVVLDPAVFNIYKDRCHSYVAGSTTAVSGPKIDDDVFELL